MIVRVLNLHIFIREGYCISCLQVARLTWDSAVKYSTPESVAILMRDSVAILLASDSSTSAGFPWITTATTPFLCGWVKGSSAPQVPVG